MLAAQLVAVVVAGAVLAGSASAQQTPGLAEARARAERMATEINDAEVELSQLELQVVGTENAIAAAEAEAEALSGDVVAAAIADFTSQGDAGRSVLASDDFNQAIRLGTLNEAALGADGDALEDYRVIFEDLEVLRSALVEQRANAEAAFALLVATREELTAELARLEELEAERLAEEARQREEAARRAAAERAAAGGTTSSGTTSGTTSSGGTPVLSGGGGGTTLTYCPVAGAHSFIDSWGYPRSGGRRHKGVDMMANIGVPIVAPVSGTVTHRSNRVGGRSFHLNGDDGNYYYGTHLSSYGQSGWVAAGTVIGYVGDDGNAAGIPHLHFEIHPGGGAAVNPYPYVREVC